MTPIAHATAAPRLGRVARPLLLALVLAGAAGGALRQAGARPISDGGAGPEQEATATPWVPDGSWQLRHGPKLSPLWTGGPGRQEAPCGEMGAAGQRGTAAPLCGVHGVPDGQGGWLLWAVGEEGMLARYQNGSWQKLDDLSPAKTSPRTYHLHDVFALSATEVWAVGWVEGDPTCISENEVCGAVLRYDGSRWQAMERVRMGISGCMAKLNAIDMAVDEQGVYGWAVGDKQCGTGGALYLSYDGAAWKWVRVPQASRDLHDVRIVHRRDVWAVGEFGIESHYFEPAANPAWSVLGKSGADDLFALDLADATFGWDGGVNGRLNRYLGACHDDDPFTQCWFDNQASPVQDAKGNKLTLEIYAIDLLDRSRGWLVGEQDSRRSFIAQLYLDKRWKTVPVDNDPGEALYGLFAPDASWAVAVGDEGVIVEYRAAAAPTPSPTVSPSASPRATPSASPSVAPTPSRTPTVGPLDPTATVSPEPGPSASPVEPTATDPSPGPSPSASATVTDAPPLPTATAGTARLSLPFLMKSRVRR